MSNKVDNRAVEMQFNNSQFEGGVKTTLDSLDRLKKGLNLDGAAKSLSGLSDAGKRFSLSGMGSGIDTMIGKFGALQIAGVAALATIVSEAVSAGTKIAKALTVPYSGGFKEYEKGLGAFQTILANTASAGSTSKDVTAALAEMNKYANLTKYSFGDMSDAMATFTANGVSLKNAVPDVKGLYNLVSITGGDATKASSAVYQLSQAIATGSVKLQDWNSVVNAGIGGPDFQNQLIQTAKIHGVNVDAMIKKDGSFRDSLTQNQWLTSQILEETLAQYGNTVDAQTLKAQGATDAQIKQILELGKRAEAASTQLKTFSQLWDTLTSNSITGWATTFKIVLGDLDEATQLWSSIGNVIGGVFGKMADDRNALLQGWKDLGGRTELIKGLANVFKFLGDVLKPIHDAFREIFPKTTSKQLYDITHAFFLFTQQLQVGSGVAGVVKTIFKGLFEVIKIGVSVIGGIAGGIGVAFGALLTGGKSLDALSGTFGEIVTIFRQGAMNIINLSNFAGSSIKDIFHQVGQVISNTAKVIGTALFGGGFVSNVSGFASSLKDNVGGALSTFGDALKTVWSSVSTFLSNMGLSASMVGTIVQPFVNAFKLLGDAITVIDSTLKSAAGPFIDLVLAISGAATKLFDALGKSFDENGAQSVFDLLGGALMLAIMDNLRRFINFLGDVAKNGPALAKGIVGILDELKGCLKAYQKDIKAAAILKIAEAVGILAISIAILSQINPTKLGIATGAITAMFAELSGIMLVLNKVDMKSITGGKMLAMGAEMLLLAIAIGILAGALSKMASLSWGELARGMAGMVVTVGLLIAASKLMSVNKEATWESAALFIAFASAVKIMAGAVEKLAKVVAEVGAMDVKTLVKGIIVVGIVLGELFVFLKYAKFDKMGLTQAAGLFILATALNMISLAVSGLGKMNLGDIAKGIGALSIILGEIVIFNASVKSSNASPATMLAMAASLLIIAVTLRTIGSMPFEQILKSVITLGVVLAELVIAMNLIPKDPVSATAMLAMAGSLLILAVALKMIGGISGKNLVKGIIALAAAMGVMVGMGYAIAPIADVLIAVGGALLMFGGAIFLAGAGIGLLAAGLTVLVGLGAAGLEAFKGMILVFASTLPTIMAAVGTAIVALCDTIIKGAPKILEAIGVIVGGIIVKLTELIPKVGPLITAFIQMIIKVINDNIVNLVQCGLNVLMALLNGIRNNIGQIVTVVGEIIIQFLAAFATQVVAITNAILDDLVMVINGVANAIRSHTASFTAAVKNLIDAIFGLMVSMLGMFSDIGAKIINGIGSGLANVVGLIGGKIHDAVNAVYKQFVSWMNTFIDIGVKVIQSIGSGLKDVVGLIGGKIHDAVNAAYKQFVSWMNTFTDVGIKILQSIALGMADCARWLGGAVKSAMNWLYQHTLGYLGFGSPSKQFIEIGNRILSSVGLGLLEVPKYIGPALSTATDGIVAGMKNGLSALSDVLNTDININPTIRPVVDMTDVQNGINSTFSSVPSINVAATQGKASYAAATSATSISKKSPGDTIVDKSTNPIIHIVQNNTVRNDQDIHKINQDLQHLLDRYSAAKGVVTA